MNTDPCSSVVSLFHGRGVQWDIPMGFEKLETPLFFPFVFLLIRVESFDDFLFTAGVSESLPVLIDQDSHKIPVAAAVPMKTRRVSFHSQQPPPFTCASRTG